MQQAPFIGSTTPNDNIVLDLDDLSIPELAIPGKKPACLKNVRMHNRSKLPSPDFRFLFLPGTYVHTSGKIQEHNVLVPGTYLEYEKDSIVFNRLMSGTSNTSATYKYIYYGDIVFTRFPFTVAYEARVVEGGSNTAQNIIAQSRSGTNTADRIILYMNYSGSTILADVGGSSTLSWSYSFNTTSTYRILMRATSTTYECWCREDDGRPEYLGSITNTNSFPNVSSHALRISGQFYGSNVYRYKSDFKDLQIWDAALTDEQCYEYLKNPYQNIEII